MGGGETSVGETGFEHEWVEGERERVSRLNGGISGRFGVRHAGRYKARMDTPIMPSTSSVSALYLTKGVLGSVIFIKLSF